MYGIVRIIYQMCHITFIELKVSCIIHLKQIERFP